MVVEAAAQGGGGGPLAPAAHPVDAGDDLEPLLITHAVEGDPGGAGAAGEGWSRAGGTGVGGVEQGRREGGSAGHEGAGVGWVEQGMRGRWWNGVSRA